MKLPPQRPPTIRVDRAIWESVTNLLTRLTENPNNESIHFFQGSAEVLLERIAENQRRASPTPPSSSTASDRRDHPTAPNHGQQLSRS